MEKKFTDDQAKSIKIIFEQEHHRIACAMQCRYTHYNLASYCNAVVREYCSENQINVSKQTLDDLAIKLASQFRGDSNE